MELRYTTLLTLFFLALGSGLNAQTPVSAGGGRKVETVRNESVFMSAGSTARDGHTVEGNVESLDRSVAIPFEESEIWVMASVFLVDNTGDKSFVSAEESAVKADFVPGKTILAYDGKGGFKLESLKGVFYRGLEERNGSNITWTMGNAECPTCGKKLYLTLMEHNAGRMTIKMASEDKGDALAYVFNFIKSNP